MWTKGLIFRTWGSTILNSFLFAISCSTKATPTHPQEETWFGVEVAITNPWARHLCSKNKLLGSRYIREITGTATLVCTKNNKISHGTKYWKITTPNASCDEISRGSQVFRTGKHLTKHVCTNDLFCCFLLCTEVFNAHVNHHMNQKDCLSTILKIRVQLGKKLQVRLWTTLNMYIFHMFTILSRYTVAR